jgi:hypothetical protein
MLQHHPQLLSCLHTHLLYTLSLFPLELLYRAAYRPGFAQDPLLLVTQAFQPYFEELLSLPASKVAGIIFR